MNLNGIGYTPGAIRPPQTENRPRVEQERGAGVHPSAPQAPSAPQRLGPLGGAAPANALPVEPPAGTDPDLWAVLTQEERTFFAKVGAMGPLTYGHIISSQGTGAPAMRGGRLDVKA